MKREIVFVVQAYETRAENGQLIDVCELQLFSSSADDALERAKKIIQKSHYRISRIIEKDLDA